MNSKHRSIVKQYKDHLKKSIDLNVLLPNLEESKIFTKAMIMDIKLSKVDMYDELLSRGPEAFDKFIDTLIKSGYSGEANVLSSDKSRLDEIDYKRNSQSNCPHQSFSTTADDVSLVVINKDKYELYSPSKDIYKMLSKPRGYCLIINNVEFSGLLETREGSDVDAESLKDTFTQLGYDVEIEKNLDSKRMSETLENFAMKKEHVLVDSCVVIILSHGGIGDTINGIDGGSIKLNKVLGFFNNRNCEHLKGKPKMFFLQACRGKKRDCGIKESADSVKVSSFKESADAATFIIPSCTDMLIAFPTLTEHISVRHHVLGSWFMRELVNVLKLHSWNTDLISMLQKVDRHIKQKISGEGDKQVTEQRLLGLDKKIYFNPL